jgi:hypothetical protein
MLLKKTAALPLNGEAPPYQKGDGSNVLSKSGHIGCRPAPD